MDIYKENGFDSREDYLEFLANEYGVDFDHVKSYADVLGPNEDFDGLVSGLEDLVLDLEDMGQYHNNNDWEWEI